MCGIGGVVEAFGETPSRELLEQIGIIGDGLLPKRCEQFADGAQHSRIERAFLLQAGGQH